MDAELNSFMSEFVPTDRCSVFGYHKAEIDKILYIIYIYIEKIQCAGHGPQL